ncbi:MAG: hypothetical protein WA658_17400, partial [Candidatus Acidiferrales bacterium]
MPDERTAAGKKPFHREHGRGEARLDQERAIAELTRYLDVAIPEMGLALEYAISEPATVDGGPDDKDIVVAFSGA